MQRVLQTATLWRRRHTAAHSFCGSAPPLLATPYLNFAAAPMRTHFAGPHSQCVRSRTRRFTVSLYINHPYGRCRIPPTLDSTT